MGQVLEGVTDAGSGLRQAADGAGRLNAGLVQADVAYWAATLLGRLQAQAAGTVSPLTAALAENRPLAVRERAAWALEQIGPAARDALPALRQAAASKQPRLARLANEAIAAIGQ